MHVRDDESYLRIGELARRTGVTPELLRAWEQRYGLLHPARSDGGFRLYSDLDERRIRRMKALIDQGVSASEAARRSIATDEAAQPAASVSADRSSAVAIGVVQDLRTRLQSALDEMNGEQAHRIFDEVLAMLSMDAVLGEIVMPYLAELGRRWSSGEVSIAQEHFASNLIRGRLMGIARNWGSGDGPKVVLACPPGEAHDLGLIVFGIEIARAGWRVIFLGADTPIATIEAVARETHPSLVVLAATDPRRVWAEAEGLRRLKEMVPVVLGGSVTVDEFADLDIRVLGEGPIEGARLIAKYGAVG
jgi:DNA-binding transcriptional MerR regulator